MGHPALLRSHPTGLPNRGVRRTPPPREPPLEAQKLERYQTNSKSCGPAFSWSCYAGKTSYISHRVGKDIKARTNQTTQQSDPYTRLDIIPDVGPSHEGAHEEGAGPKTLPRVCPKSQRFPACDGIRNRNRKSRNFGSPGIQLGGVLRYKWEAYCDTNGRNTESMSPQASVAPKVP